MQVFLAMAGFAGAGELHAFQPPATQTSQRHLPRGFVSKTLKMPNGEERKYAVFVPPQYAEHPDHRWPAIIFLHGSAECGNDGIKQTTVGFPVYVMNHATRFPFIVIMPQAHQMWFRGPEAGAVWAILDEADRDYRIDHDRIYLTGLSMGGFATWELAVLRPDVFAAIVPVCGVAPNEYLANIKDIPVWAFHGAQDANVSVAGSRDAISALRKLGASPNYTEYKDLSHVCWDRAYNEPGLYKWLLQQRRRPPPNVVDYRFPGGLSRAWWLAVESQTGAKMPAHIHGEIGDAGRVTLTSEGVANWGLISNGPPLPPETEITVTWNGKEVFKGTFHGVLTNEAGETDSGRAEKKATTVKKGG
jgi:predicted esterase